jgi:hypothetical protein
MPAHLHARSCASTVVALCCILQWSAAVACDATSPAISSNSPKESNMTQPPSGPPSRSSSRGRAPVVPPVEHEGVRYEPLQAASSEGLAPGVYIKATDVKSGQRLWTTRLWETSFDANREADVQNVFVRSLKLDASAGLVRVEDEKGRAALVELKDGKVRPSH